MTAVLFGPGPGAGRGPGGGAGKGPGGGAGGRDRLGRAATERDGATSLLVGLAGNASLATGAPVRVADLLDLSDWQ
jgi:hypothetical protein